MTLAFGLSAIFYALIIQEGSYNNWAFPLMMCPTIAAIITKRVYDRTLSGLGWKLGSPKLLLANYLIPIVYVSVIYSVALASRLTSFNPDSVAEAASFLNLGNAPV